MKITRRQLRQIIREELVREHETPGGSFHGHTNYPPVEWPDVEKAISELQKEVDSGRPKSGDDNFDTKMAEWEKKVDRLKKYKKDLSDSKERHSK